MSNLTRAGFTFAVSAYKIIDSVLTVAYAMTSALP